MFTTHVGYLATTPAVNAHDDAELEALSIDERNAVLAQFNDDIAEYHALIEQAAIDRAEQARAEFYAAELYEVAA